MEKLRSKNIEQQTSLGIFFSNDFPVRAFTYWNDETCEKVYLEMLEIKLAVDLINMPENGHLGICFNDEQNFLPGEVLVNGIDGEVLILSKEVFNRLYYTLPGLQCLGIGNFPSWIYQARDKEDYDIKSFPVIINSDQLDLALRDYTEKQDLLITLASHEWPAGHKVEGLHVLVGSPGEEVDFIFDIQWTTPKPFQKVFYFFRYCD